MNKMKIPLVDLTVQHRSLYRQMRHAFKKVIEKSDFILGEELRLLEAEFARFTGTRYAVGISSGLDALRLSLTALGIGRGDEIIVPVHTYIATALAVSHVGATPRLVDIDENTYNIDPAKIEAAINSRTRAIIPVHLFGQPAEMSKIMALARKHRLAVIEDACQAHGARYHGKRVGSFGDVGCFSFYPSKNMGALGDGGIITTQNEAMAQTLIQLRNYGQSAKYIHDLIGYNNRLDTLQAAALRIKLKHLDRWNRNRKAVAQLYNRALRQFPLYLPYLEKDRDHVYHLYVIRLKERDALKQYLAERGISTGIYYPVPMHLQNCYRRLGYTKGAFPVTERFSLENLALPMYPEMTRAQVKMVTQAIQDFFSKRGAKLSLR